MARGPNRRRVDRVPGERRRQAARDAPARAPVRGRWRRASRAAGWGPGASASRASLLRVERSASRGSPAPRRRSCSSSRRSARRPPPLPRPRAVEAALRRHPWIASVEVRRRSRPRSRCRVVERRPAALVDLGGALPGGRPRRGVQARAARRRARPAGGDRHRARVVGGAARGARSAARGRARARRALVRPRPGRARGGLGDPRGPGLRDHALGGTTGWRSGSGRESIAEKLARLDRVLSALDAEGQRAEVLHLDNRRRPDWVAVRVAGRRGEPDGKSYAAAEGGGGPQGRSTPAR